MAGARTASDAEALRQVGVPGRIDGRGGERPTEALQGGRHFLD
eukprot:SAG31_NODE_3945_length_3729_cov_4.246832_7_plen_43_part_00